MKKGFLLLLLLLSCSKKIEPEDVLRKVINLSLGPEDSRQELISLTTGSMKAEIETLDAENVKKLFVENGKISLKSFKVSHKKCADIQCFITYVVTYNQEDRNNKEIKAGTVESKKIAELVWIEESWKLKSVSNEKSYIDMSLEIEPNSVKY